MTYLAVLPLPLVVITDFDVPPVEFEVLCEIALVIVSVGRSIRVQRNSVSPVERQRGIKVINRAAHCTVLLKAVALVPMN